jgi:cardiolipin synthase
MHQAPLSYSRYRSPKRGGNYRGGSSKIGDRSKIFFDKRWREEDKLELGEQHLLAAPMYSSALCTTRLRRRAALILPLAIAAVCAAGCASVSDSWKSIHAARLFHRHGVKFADGEGPISNPQGHAIIASLEQATGSTDILHRHLAFEQAITGSSLIVGNKVTLLENGADTYRAMFNAIEGADDNINLETYEFDDDPIGQEFADALIAKQRAGIQVNVIYDSFGSLGTPESFFHRMRESGIRVLQFNPLSPMARRFHWSAAHRDHRKLLVVDGKIAIMGGINISNVYSSSPGSGHVERERGKQVDLGSWRDTDIEIQGPAVAECQKLFIAHWNGQKGRPLSPRHYFVTVQPQGNQIVRIIGFSPGELSVIYVTLLSAINNSESNVCITDAYFAPDHKMLEAMESASRRGVDVRLLLPGSPDTFLIGAAARSHYSDLLESGVKIYEWKGRMLHAKTATIDHVWSTVGSSNLDWWSIARNDEINATILSVGFGAQMDRMFDTDLDNAVRIEPRQWESRSLWERMKEAFARIIQPFL